MGMFDYKNYSSNEAAKLVEDISLLSALGLTQQSV